MFYINKMNNQRFAEKPVDVDDSDLISFETYDESEQYLRGVMSYADLRQRDYPSLAEQLDMIYHSGALDNTDWANCIAAIKARYPRL